MVAQGKKSFGTPGSHTFFELYSCYTVKHLKITYILVNNLKVNIINLYLLRNNFNIY